MPFVRITLAKGRSATFKQQISHAVHQALIEAFGIPEDDRFQVIEELEPENMVFPPRYMGIPHSERMIYIQITAKEGRSAERKQALYRTLAALIAQQGDQSSDDLVITLVENDAANWSFGRGEAQLLQ
ncbi:tautomerase family protein [Sedimenticola sp.]|uniref:tautomerase family protein n=1 Tax=Sedimenticola sp. TaxID=1940285 RepID=UPI003D137602